MAVQPARARRAPGWSCTSRRRRPPPAASAAAALASRRSPRTTCSGVPCSAASSARSTAAAPQRARRHRSRGPTSPSGRSTRVGWRRATSGPRRSLATARARRGAAADHGVGAVPGSSSTCGRRRCPAARCRRGTGGRTPAGDGGGRAPKRKPGSGSRHSYIAPTLGATIRPHAWRGDAAAARPAHEAHGEADVGRRGRRASSCGAPAPRPCGCAATSPVDVVVPEHGQVVAEGDVEASSGRTPRVEVDGPVLPGRPLDEHLELEDPRCRARSRTASTAASVNGWRGDGSNIVPTPRRRGDCETLRRVAERRQLAVAVEVAR